MRPNFAERASAYGLATADVDGNSVTEVYDAAVEALDRARSGGGPTAIVATTMRMLGHAIHDGAEYVPREMLAEWERKDPIARHREQLISTGIVTEQQIDAIETAARERILEAVATVEAAPFPDPDSLTDGVYA